MRAAVYQGPGAVTVEDVPEPVAGPEDVVVEVSHCGICGTDLHFVLEGWGTPGSIGGHEWSGRVASVGGDVADWSVGDAVTARPAAYGTPDWQGAFARLVRVPASDLVPVPSGVELRTAALTEPLAVAMHAVNRAGSGVARVLVTGAGPIGMLAVAALRARGVADITVSEPSELRRARALEVGAASAVAPSELPPVPAMPFEVAEGAFDAVIECSGKVPAMEAGLGLLKPHGVLVLAGTGMQRPSFDVMRLLVLELVVTGSMEYDDDGFEQALALLASGSLPVSLLIEPDDVPLSGMLDAMKRLAAGELAGKVLVSPE